MNLSVQEKGPLMFSKEITMFGKRVVVACDGRCNKAWGISSRPKVEFDTQEPDDVAWLADDELGDAPANPRSYEGRDGKPDGPQSMNKWCYRQCERSKIADLDETFSLPDFSKRVFNQPWKHVLKT